MGNRENRTGIFELGQNPELADLFRVALRGLSLSLRTHTVGTVVAYNAATQRATVRVDVLQVIKDLISTPTAADPNPTSTQGPVILTNIPVAWPRTGSAFLHLPLNPGDTGELHVQDRTLQQWTALGQATDPVGAFTHSLGDSVFHPSVAPDTNPMTPPALFATHAVVEGPLIALGAVAASPLVKGTELASAFTAYTTAVASAFATWGGIIPPTAISNGAFLAAIGAANALLASSIANWLSQKSFTE
jgi:hypothetical protein